MCQSIKEKIDTDDKIPPPHPDTYNVKSSVTPPSSAGSAPGSTMTAQNQPPVDLVKNAYGQMMQNYGDPEQLPCWHGVCARQEAEGIVIRTQVPPGFLGCYLARISSASRFPAQCFAVTLCNSGQVAHVLVLLKEGGYGFSDQGALVYPTLNDLFTKDPVLSQSFAIPAPKSMAIKLSFASFTYDFSFVRYFQIRESL